MDDSIEAAIKSSESLLLFHLVLAGILFLISEILVLAAASHVRPGNLSGGKVAYDSLLVVFVAIPWTSALMEYRTLRKQLRTANNPANGPLAVRQRFAALVAQTYAAFVLVLAMLLFWN